MTDSCVRTVFFLVMGQSTAKLVFQSQSGRNGVTIYTVTYRLLKV